MVKISIAFTSFFLAATAAFAEGNCKLYLMQPSIVYHHPTLGDATNNGDNSIGDQVTNILENNGFKIVYSISSSKYVMLTRTECGPVLGWFGYTDMCKTNITFENEKGDIIKKSNQSIPSAGVSMNFNGISSLTCEDLQKAEQDL